MERFAARGRAVAYRSPPAGRRARGRRRGDRRLGRNPASTGWAPRDAATTSSPSSRSRRARSNKYEWDEELGAIKLDRLLFSSLGYPTDYGFFRETLAADGDPLDAMIVVSEPTFPGCLIEVKPVALFRMRDQKAEDNKILCVPHTDPNWSHIERLEDLPMTLRDEISHFFSIYKTPEWKVVRVDGWYPREDALESIERARGAGARRRRARGENTAGGVRPEERVGSWLGFEPEVAEMLERQLRRDHRPVRRPRRTLRPPSARR